MVLSTGDGALILRLTTENARWGYKRIHDELDKRGYRIGASTVRAVRAWHHIPPAPERAPRRSIWRQFLAQHTRQMKVSSHVPLRVVTSKACVSATKPAVRPTKEARAGAVWSGARGERRGRWRQSRCGHRTRGARWCERCLGRRRRRGLLDCAP